MYALASTVGFPLPFSIITMSPLCVPLFVMPMVPWMIKAFKDPITWPLVMTSLKVLVCQEVMVIVYPTYFYVFTMVPNRGKAYFALVLPLLKLVFRHAMAKTVGYLSDEVPEGVILNVEVISALFIAYCMQNNSSVNTMVALMAIDALQTSASLHDIWTTSRRMDALIREMGKWKEIHTRHGVSEVNVAQEIFSRCGLSRVEISMKPILPLESDVSCAKDTKLELQYVQELKRVLYITEFVVLLNYVEVIIPLIFSAYLLMMYHLPNRAYYKQIDGMDKTQLWETLSNVLLYAGLQLLSLLALNLVLWHKMRLSGFRQLSFVLERQCSPVQNKLILWVFYNVQTALQHFGTFGTSIKT
eukprot:jgi/Phyca11/97907/e_gw1.2.365.1